MKRTLLALLIAPALISQSATAADQNRAISYLTSWGLADGDATTLKNSKIDTFLLSFGKWDAQGNIETSDNIATVPEYNAWWMPTAYTTWTQLKHADPNKKFMVAFGGQTYESIWSEITTPEKREVVAESLAKLLKQPFPVYKKNLSESEMVGECLNWNWNQTQCDMSTYQRAGSVYLDGIDFDFEKADRLTEKENDDLLQLATRVRELVGKDKMMSLTTYHVGADPINCSDSKVFENCSFVEDKRSTHYGEVIPLLQKSKNIFDFYNVMTYDAGQNFLWKTAMNNYANALGEKSKLLVGTTINSQWGPENNFVESKENNLERTRWQKQQGFGGFFTWTVGANTENMSVSQQVDYINEMKSAADNAESLNGFIDSVDVSPGRVTVMMPEDIFNSKNTIFLYVNGKYVSHSENGRSYYSYKPSKVEGQDGFYTVVDLKKGDAIEVLLKGESTGNKRVVLTEITATEEMLALPNVNISSVEIKGDSISVKMTEDVFKGKNNIVLYVNGKYLAESFEGKAFYSSKPSNTSGQYGFVAKTKLNKGDLVEVKLKGGVPGAGQVTTTNKSLYKATVQ